MMIFKLRGLGWSQQEIADEIGLSRQAVAYQLNRLKKLSLEEGAEAALKAALLGGVAIAGGVALALLIDQFGNNWTDNHEPTKQEKYN